MKRDSTPFNHYMSIERRSNHEMDEPRPLFSLGQLVWTPGAQELFSRLERTPLELLQRHVTGDWGNMVEEDKQANQDALEHGSRIFSSYELESGQKIWVITERDRSVTTLLLPEEY